MNNPNEYLEKLLEDTDKSRAVLLSLLEDQHIKVKELNESKIKYQSLFENSPISLWKEDLSEVKNYLNQHCPNLEFIETFLNENPNIIHELLALVKVLDVNQTTLKLYKAENKDHLFRNFHKIFTINSVEVFKGLLIKLSKSVYEFETESVNKNLKGDNFNIKLKYSIVPGYEKTWEQIIISIVDITHEKKISEKLKLSEQRFIEAQAIAKFGNWSFDFKSNTISRSKEIYNIMGIDESDQISTFETFTKFIHKDDLDGYQEKFDTAIKNQKPYEHNYRIITPKGETKYILEKGYTFFDEKNEPIRTVGTAQDITDNYLAEIKIKDSQLQYQVLFDSAPIALFEEDFTEVIKKLYQIGAHAENINQLVEDPQLLQQCLQLVFVNNINQEALKLFKAESKEHFHQFLPKLFTKHAIDVIKNIFIDITQGKSESAFETTLRKVDGELFHALVRFAVLKYKKESGKLIFSVEDISLRKKLLLEIEEQQLNLNQAQKIALIGSFTLNHLDNSIIRTDEFYRIFESSPEELPTREECFLGFVHPDDRDPLVEIFHNAIEELKSYELTYRIYTGKNNLKYIYEKGNTYTDENGKPIKTIGTLQDITEKVLFENELDKSRKTLEKTLYSMTDGFVHLDKNWKYTHINPNAAKMFGRNPNDLIGKHIWTEFPEGIDQPFYKNYYKALENQEPITFEDFYEPWNRWYENRVIPSSEGLSIFFQDITDRKNASKKIEEAHNIIINSNSIAIVWLNELTWPVKYVSENIERILGYTSDEVLKDLIDFSKIMHPNDFINANIEAEQYLNNLNVKNYALSPYRVFTKDGKIRWIAERTHIIRNENDEIIELHGFIEDITEKYSAELELEKTHQVLENTLKDMTDGFVHINREFEYNYVNQQAADFLHKTINELVGYKLWEVFPSVKNQPFHLNCKEVMDTQKPKVYEEFFKEHSRWFENRIYPSSEGVSIFFNDITDRKEVELKTKEAHNIIINSSSIAIIWENDPSWPTKYVSENIERILGYTPKELLKEIIDFSKIMHPDDIEKSNEEVLLYLNDSSINQYELSPYRVYKKDGKIRWISERTQIIRDEHNKVLELRGFMDDITEQYLLENAINSILNSVTKLTGNDYLKEITKQLSHVLGTEHTFIGLNDEENSLIINSLYNCYNGKIVENFSYNLVGTPCCNLINGSICCYEKDVANLFPEDTLLAEMEIEGYIGVPLIDSQNQTIGLMVGLYKSPIENKHFAESVIQLFSTRTSAEIERLNTEKKLKEAENTYNKQLKKLNIAIDSVKDVVFMTDTNGVFNYVNDHFTKLYGYQPYEVIGKATPRILKSGLLKEEDYRFLWTTLLNKKPINLEIVNKNKAGKLIDIETSLSSITNDNNELIGFVSIQRNITERKIQEQKLLESEEEGWALFENSPNMIWIEDYSKIKLHFDSLRKNGITNLRTYLNENPHEIKKLGDLIEVKKVNKKSLEFYGVETQEELLRNITDFFTQESYLGFKEELISVFEGKLKYSSEVPIRKLNGQLAYLSLNITIPENNKEKLDKVIVSFNDITDRIRNEKTKEVILNIAKEISEVSTLRELSLIVKTELSSLIDTSNFYIAIYNEGTDTISIPYFKDIIEKDELEEVFEAEGSLTGYVIKTKKPLVVDKERFNQLMEKGLVKLIGPDSDIWLGVPFFIKNEVKGAIVVQSYTNAFAYNENDQKILEIVSDQIANAIERIQHQNAIKENEEKFRSIFELSPDLILVLNMKGIIIDCNDITLRTIQYKNKTQIIGRSINDVFRKEINQSAVEVFNSILSNSNTINKELEFKQNDGNYIIVEVTGTIIKNEKPEDSIILTVGRDITQRKKHEQEITNALEKAKEADRLKSAFLANMSHEIRTPMNGIIGFAEMLQNNDLNEEKRSFYANIIMNSSRQLLSIINDVLDMSTIEAGLVEIKKTPVSINNMLQELHEFFLQKSDEKKLRLSCELTLNNELSVINTDQTKVQQILTNFISNAIKFTKKGEVAFGYTFKDNFLEFYVSDTGIGIDKKLHKEIFERFRQVNMEYTRETIGNGLGLSISKKLVELLGGEIWLESEPNKGSTFYFTLPYQHDVLDKTNYTNTPTITQKSMNEQITILLAEDEEYNRIFIEEILDDKNYSILTAENGVEAVEIAKNHPEIMFVLMDIKMPIMNGIEASKLIREFNKTVPIIALTAFSMESDKVHLLKEGFDDYVSKPIVKKDLMQILDKYVKLNKQ